VTATRPIISSILIDLQVIESKIQQLGRLAEKGGYKFLK
jgi:hypothetical protein